MYTPYSIVASDIDQDGDVDLIAGDYYAFIYWHENDGDQSFSDNLISGEWTNHYIYNAYYALDTGDIDGDGIIGVSDTLDLLANFGCVGVNCTGDVNGDNIVGVADILQLLSVFGNSC